MFDQRNLERLMQAEGGLSRRLFMAFGASLAGLPWLSATVGASSARLRLADSPFSLGVASGDPSADGFVIWTRLAPTPLVPGGGMPRENAAVTWEVAEDDAFKTVVQRGTATATPQLAHSVHVELRGLKPDRWHWYRFRYGDADSAIGRARTFAPIGQAVNKFRFAFASCQHYETGLFTAYEHMAKDELDLVIHLGDYIYEDEGKAGRIRKHIGNEIHSLDDYRIRHSQYRLDPLLQAMHAKAPWVVTWDDHEVDNNYAGEISEKASVDVASLLARRANAYQAYYEMMPLRRRSLPHGPDMRLYRSVDYGNLLRFNVLDTRQYRSDHVNNDKASVLNAAALANDRSMLGRRQAGWLKARLIDSAATWNVLAQQVMFGMAGFESAGERKYSMDQWPGYAAERMALIDFIRERAVANPVILTGDIHSNWINDVRVDDRKLESPVIATEFVGTSISSGGNGSGHSKAIDKLLSDNPFVRLHNRQRGYVRCTVTPHEWRADYRVVPEVTKPGGAVLDLASFVTAAGKAGAEKAG